MTAALIDISPRTDPTPSGTARSAESGTPSTGFDEAISDAVDRARPDRREQRPQRERAGRDEDHAAESGLTPTQVEVQQTARTTRRGSNYDASHHAVARRVMGANSPNIAEQPAQPTAAEDQATVTAKPTQPTAAQDQPAVTAKPTQPTAAQDQPGLAQTGRPASFPTRARDTSPAHGAGTEHVPRGEQRHTRGDSNPIHVGRARIDGLRTSGTEVTRQPSDTGSAKGLTDSGARAASSSAKGKYPHDAAPKPDTTDVPATRHGATPSGDGATAAPFGDLSPAATVLGDDRAGSARLTEQGGTRPVAASHTTVQPTGVEVTALPTTTGSTANSTPISTPAPVAAPPLPIAQPEITGILAQLRGRVDGTYQLRAMVHPAELGAVNITATISHGSVSVLLHGDAQAQQTLSQSLPQLRDHLADQGFTGVDVGLGSSGHQAQDGNRPDEYHAQGSDHSIGNTADVTDDEVTAIRRRHAGAIDGPTMR